MSEPAPKPITNLSELEAALESDIRRVRKSKRNTLIATAGLAVFMLAYLTWLYSSVATIMDEINLAKIVASRTRNYIPEAKTKLASALLTYVPQGAEVMADLVIEHTPAFRRTLEERCDRIVDTAVRQFDTELDRAIKETLLPREHDIRKLLRDLSDDERSKVVEKELQMQITSLYRQSAKQSVGQFRNRLKTFDASLQDLFAADANQLLPKQQNKKMLILYLVAYFETLFVDTQQTPLPDFLLIGRPLRIN